MNPTLISLALLASLATFAYLVITKLRVLLRMAPENRFDQPLRRLGLLFRIGLGQSKLVGRKRERSAGAMHFFIFWGFVILGLREIIVFGEGYMHGFQEVLPLLGSDSIAAYVYTFVYNLFEVTVLCMVLFALYRRFAIRPARLTLNREANTILFMILGVVITDLVFDAAKFNLIGLHGHELHHLRHPVFGTEMDWAPFASGLAWLISSWGEGVTAGLYQMAYWAHVAVILVFLNLLPDSKHAHVITALPNVLFGSLGYPHTPVALLDVENEAAWEQGKLGVDRIEHLTWKQGLDLYTCTECGRCYDICPTYVTGKPLTLKWFNESLRDHLREEEAHLNRTGASSGEKELVGDVISPDTLWACTTCRACEEVCPVSIEHVPRIVAMRQAQTLLHEAQPEELNNTYRGLERNGNPWGLGYDQRANWAEGLDIPILTAPPAGDVDVVMWVGCMGAFDNRSQKIAKATAALMHKAGVRFAIMGTAEKCTGDLARRSGNEMLYQTLARENVETLNGLQVKKLVTICPHCLNSLKNEYPQLDGHYEVYHHTQYIAQLVQEGRLQIDGKLTGTVTYHDPCYLGRYNNEYDAPRDLLARSSQDAPVEMRRARNESFCCGAGGARMWMEENIGTRVNEERLRQAREVGARTIATGCPFCMTMLADGVAAAGAEEEVRVLDIAEIVLQSLRT
ncbi:MAG: (Fe-S)-binding protein [Candidatus Lambdaproteobacteria bacterium]|nr:(Fe-S)-binding protein [Candidatus Lambdaproteobacteria bacterium]